MILGLGTIVLLFLLLTACQLPRPQRGGGATTLIAHGSHTNSAVLTQSDNPKDPSRQTVQSEQTIEYVLPPGAAISLGSAGRSDLPETGACVSTARGGRGSSLFPGSTAVVVLDKPVPVRLVTKDRTETSVGGAQKDMVREWAGRAANMQPVMWAGIAMMTLVAGVLAYFGWWTKAAMAVGVGLGMIVLAQTLPDHGAAIVLGGLGVFGVAALLILYSYYKGQWDKNQNGIPDFLEKGQKTT
jgi:hypothetical protein